MIVPIEFLTKEDLRYDVFDTRKRLHQNTIKVKSTRIIENLESWVPFNNIRSIGLYSPINGEVDTNIIANRYFGKVEISYPKLVSDKIFFYKVNNFNELEEGSFGISEPNSNCARQYFQLDMVLIPGVVFSRSGDRIGYGKGHIDRYLSKVSKNTTKVGLAYNFQLCDFKPEDHDVPVDFIVTETSIIRCS